MGTRGLAGFIIDGRIVASYNHFDSYPEHLGTQILTFARGVEPTFDETVAAVRALRPVQADAEPSADELVVLEAHGIATASKVSTGADWYSWLREQQGDLDAMLRVGIHTDDAAFLDDGLFCEWAYLVDLDDMMLRVYSGGRNEVAAFLLGDLPTEEAFLAALADA